jgi:hypothetical protein
MQRSVVMKTRPPPRGSTGNAVKSPAPPPPQQKGASLCFIDEARTKEREEREREVGPDVESTKAEGDDDGDDERCGGHSSGVNVPPLLLPCLTCRESSCSLGGNAG